MYAVLAREFRSFPPVRDYFFFPLPVLHLRVFRWPAIRDPVRLSVGWRASGAPRKSDNHGHIQPLRKQNCLPKALAIMCRMLFVRMDRISMTTQRRHVNATIFEFLFPCFCFSRIRQQFVDGTMPGARIATRPYFHGFEAERAYAIQHFVKRQLFVDRVEHADWNFAE